MHSPIIIILARRRERATAAFPPCWPRGARRGRWHGILYDKCITRLASIQSIPTHALGGLGTNDVRNATNPKTNQYLN